MQSTTSSRPPPDTLRYTLTLRRTGPAGTARSSQSGSFTPPTGVTDTLSTIRIHWSSDDQITIRLAVQRGGTVIDEARWQQGP